MLHALPLRRIDAWEHSPAMLAVAREAFPRFLSAPLADSRRVRLRLDDGRNGLLRSPERQDVIVAAISGAAFAGSGAIYSRDFFELVRERLTPGGVFVLWLQLHHVPEVDVRSVVATLRATFPHVVMHANEGRDQSQLVASAAPLRIDATRVAELDRLPAVRNPIQARGLESLLDLAATAVLVGDGPLRRLVSSGRADVLSDLRPVFEYRVPFGLATGPLRHDLDRFSDLALPPIEPAPTPAHALGLRGLRALAARRYPEAVRALEAARHEMGRPAWERHFARATRQLNRSAPATRRGVRPPR
jgi:SAM-dependent methyltransferase